MALVYASCLPTVGGLPGRDGATLWSDGLGLSVIVPGKECTLDSRGINVSAVIALLRLTGRSGLLVQLAPPSVFVGLEDRDADPACLSIDFRQTISLCAHPILVYQAPRALSLSQCPSR